MVTVFNNIIYLKVAKLIARMNEGSEVERGSSWKALKAWRKGWKFPLRPSEDPTCSSGECHNLSPCGPRGASSWHFPAGISQLPWAMEVVVFVLPSSTGLEAIQ